MKYLPRQKKLNKSEDGFAAIIVTLVVMTIVIMLVLGFVAIVNRESRSSIDQQLSAQAFYAAETGINDVTQLIAEGTVDVSGIKTCDDFNTQLVSTNTVTNVLDDDVEYTCVIIDDRPDNLAVSSVKTDNPTTLLLKAVDTSGDPVDLKTLTISWQAEDIPEDIEFPSAGTDFPENWDYAAPVLRAALTNLVDLNRQSLVESTYTMFLRPDDSGLGTSYGLIHNDVSSQGEVVEVGCSESLSDDDFRFCSVRLEGLDDPSIDQSADGFLLVLRAVYANADVHIQGTDINDNEVLFADQQIVIDSTGRANDVLRRVQARVPIQKQYSLPGSPIETSKLGGVCKQFTLLPPPDSSESAAACSF